MRILPILLLSLLCSCKTYNVYLIDVRHDPVSPIHTGRAAGNRFTSQFHEADSLFERASDEAMRKAYENTKHLIPNRK